MAEILKTINGQIVNTIGVNETTTIEGQIFTVFGVPAKIIIPVVEEEETEGYGHAVMGVAAGSIAAVMGVATANVSKVSGV